MNKNFRVVFYLRSTYNKNKEGLVPIRTRIYLGNERIELGSTGVKAHPDTWNSALGRLNGRSTDVKKANNELDRIELDIMHVYRHNEFNDALSLDLIKSEYLGTAIPKESFIEFYSHFLEDAKKEIGTTHSYAYFQKLSVILKHFQAFLQTKLHHKDLLMTELKYSIISGFENYLMTDGNQSHNTTMRQMRNFKTVVIRAQKVSGRKGLFVRRSAEAITRKTKAAKNSPKPKKTSSNTAPTAPMLSTPSTSVAPPTTVQPSRQSHMRFVNLGIYLR